MGLETVEVSATRVLVGLGSHFQHLARDVVDYGPLLRGEAQAADFLPAAHLSNLWIVTEILTGAAPIPGRRRLNRGMTGGIRDGRFWLEVPDTRVIEKWIEQTENRGGFAMTAQFHELLGLQLRTLDPYPAAGHLMAALTHLQTVHFGIVDDELRGAARGAAENFAELVIDHLATLAGRPVPTEAEPHPANLGLYAVQSVKSRALAELLGETVPGQGDHPLISREQEAHQRYRNARDRRDHRALREAREELEHCWNELAELGGPAAEYAALRAGVPVEPGRLAPMLAQLAVPQSSLPKTGQNQ
ncbi:hypothetical protein FDA94_00405 [Herbidospora galbida]|uniref:Uncharacterized protein n=1 Tax=Herbidospora galbida TaxID=2575442 RepID=A0A4U3MR44_9ACTN|nr:hypothetical protein [Herbidospora galbida]TKK91312.1 hypothetical protein FDA94_00405 [Herbidospora galbida]